MDWEQKREIKNDGKHRSGKKAKLQRSMENQNMSDQNWDKSREITFDNITQLRQFQSNNAETPKTDNSRKKSCLLFDCPEFLGMFV